MLTFGIISSLLSAFSILFIGRWQFRGSSLREWLIIHSPMKLSEMFSCDFCLSFWTNLCVCIIISACTRSLSPVLLAPLCTPLTRLLLR